MAALRHPAAPAMTAHDAAALSALPLAAAGPTPNAQLNPSQATLGGSTFHVLRRRAAAGQSYWRWILAGAALMTAGVLVSGGIMQCRRTASMTPDVAATAIVADPNLAPASDAAVPATGVTRLPIDAGTGAHDARSEPATALAGAGSSGAPAPEDPEIDCAAASFTKLYDIKLGTRERAAALDRLEACYRDGAVTAALHAQAQKRIGIATRPSSSRPTSVSTLRCVPADFQRLYARDAPKITTIEVALKRLKQCHKNGEIDESTYRSIQSEMLSKL